MCFLMGQDQKPEHRQAPRKGQGPGYVPAQGHCEGWSVALDGQGHVGSLCSAPITGHYLGVPEVTGLWEHGRYAQKKPFK